jgi:hypothetical protein
MDAPTNIERRMAFRNDARDELLSPYPITLSPVS